MPRSLKQSPQTPIRLMIVDDHATMRRGLLSLLAAYGPRFQVVAQAGNAHEAMVHAELTPIDLVLTDLQMKPVGGIELMGMLKHHQPKLKFVVLTASTEDDHMLQAHDAGAGGFVVKESEDGEIVRALEAVMANATHYPASLYGAIERRRQQPELTPREGQLLALIGEGKTTKEVARILHIEPRTVDAHRANIKQRFNLPSAAALIRFAVERLRNKKK